MSGFTLRKTRAAVAPELLNERAATHDNSSTVAYDAYRASEATPPEAIAKLVDVQRMFMQRVKAEALHSSRSFQMMLVSGLTPAEMRNRMITEFTALGVVCALLAGLGFAVLAVPPAKLLNSTSAAIAFCGVTLMSIICNLACVGFSTLMISSVNLLTDEITAWYIGNHGAIITNMNFQFFNAGFLLLLVALVLFAVYTYPPIIAYVCGGLAVAAAVLVITVYYAVDYARYYKLQDVVRILLEKDASAAEAEAGGGGAAKAGAGERKHLCSCFSCCFGGGDSGVSGVGGITGISGISGNSGMGGMGGRHAKQHAAGDDEVAGGAGRAAGRTAAALQT